MENYQSHQTGLIFLKECQRHHVSEPVLSMVDGGKPKVCHKMPWRSNPSQIANWPW